MGKGSVTGQGTLSGAVSPYSYCGKRVLVYSLSVSLVLWGQNSWISSGNLPADSSTAVTEEDSFHLI